MKAGLFSSVCTRFGAMASFSSTVMEPEAFSWAAVTNSRLLVWPTTMRPSRRSRSARSLDRQKIAITSLATVMSNPSWRGKPLATPPSEPTIERSERSFMSMTRRYWMRRTSRPSSLPQ